MNNNNNNKGQLSLIKGGNNKLRSQINTPLKLSKIPSVYSHNNKLKISTSNISTPHKTPSLLSTKRKISHYNNSNELSLENINYEIVIIHILPYLDLSSLPKFALTSKLLIFSKNAYLSKSVLVEKRKKHSQKRKRSHNLFH